MTPAIRPGLVLVAALDRQRAIGRGGELRWRAGPIATWALSPHWSLKGQVLFTLAGPDDLPTWQGMAGGVVLSWRSATGIVRRLADPRPTP